MDGLADCLLDCPLYNRNRNLNRNRKRNIIKYIFVRFFDPHDSFCF